MNWLFLALAGIFVTAAANIIDKYLLEKRIKNVHVPVVIDGFLGIIFSAALYLSFPIQDVSWLILFLCLFSGAMFTVALIFYFKAVQSDEVSRIVPLFNLLPLFVLVISVLILGHQFELHHYAGIFLLLIGAFLVSTTDFRRPRLSAGFFFALVMVIVGGLNTLLIEQVLTNVDFITVYFYSRIGGFLSAIPLYFFHKKDFDHTIRFPQKNGLSFILISEALALIGLLFFTQAVSLEKAALVSSIGYASPALVFILAMILSIFFPHIIKEKISRRDVIQKIVAIVFVTVGAIMLS